MRSGCIRTPHPPSKTLVKKILRVGPTNLHFSKSLGSTQALPTVRTTTLGDSWVKPQWSPRSIWLNNELLSFLCLGANVISMPLCVCMTTANWPVNVSTTLQVQTVGNARRIIRADLGVQARISPSPKALQIPVSNFCLVTPYSLHEELSSSQFHLQLCLHSFSSSLIPLQNAAETLLSILPHVSTFEHLDHLLNSVFQYWHQCVGKWCKTTEEILSKWIKQELFFPSPN